MMSTAQIHLLLNHVPVFCTLLGLPILLYGWLKKQTPVVYVALALFIVGAISAVPVYFSGEGAEDLVERLPGVLESLIETHEDLAKIAMLAVEALGLTALAGWFVLYKKPEATRWLMPVLAVLSLGTTGIMAQTAHVGGQIRHSEIRSQASADSPSGASVDVNTGAAEPEGAAGQYKSEDHDDDHDDDD
ncbi:MAG: hypothetical protein IGS03_05155 [Candidatus Sericytochromatia bacterium]|nr:hypothetical protein [Candidatus Sericytochromatia bacterium]